MTRRKFLEQTTATSAGLGLYSFLNTFGGYKKMSDPNSYRDCERCIVLGMDGLDPQILTGLIKDNKLPNFTRLADEGTFVPLRTSNPVMSPVAWSNIASGAGPDHHGIFDFLRRDPANYTPFLSLRKSSAGIFGTRYKNARQCNGFWRYTSDAGIPTTVIRWPVTFPAEKVTGRFLSGLGVPDLLGSEGQYRYYTTEMVSKN
ncbi:MAG: alkaline phosphatase family protein, partial [Planctomycetota bacterium]